MKQWYTEFNPFAIDYEKEIGQTVNEHFNPVDGAPKELLTSIGQLGVVVVSAIAFLWVTYSAIAKFRECQAGRADWGELFTLTAIAGLLLVWISFILITASDATQAELS